MVRLLAYESMSRTVRAVVDIVALVGGKEGRTLLSRVDVSECHAG